MCNRTENSNTMTCVKFETETDVNGTRVCFVLLHYRATEVVDFYIGFRVESMKDDSVCVNSALSSLCCMVNNGLNGVRPVVAWLLSLVSVFVLCVSQIKI